MSSAALIFPKTMSLSVLVRGNYFEHLFKDKITCSFHDSTNLKFNHIL